MRREKDFTKGSTVAERFKSVNTALNALLKKDRPVVAIPPVPIFQRKKRVPPDGEVFVFIFPFDGEISSVAVEVVKREDVDPKTAIGFHIVLRSDDEVHVEDVKAIKPSYLFPLQFKIKAGTKLTISTNQGDKLEDVLACVSFIPESHLAKRVVIDDEPGGDISV
jgi:hypothetical protein